MEKIEIRVRPVTRFVLTEFKEGGPSSSSRTIGEFDSQEMADKLGKALAGDDENAKFVTLFKEGINDTPRLLRTIADQLDSGELVADFGLMTMRCWNQGRPNVFRFGAMPCLPEHEFALALKEIERCVSDALDDAAQFQPSQRAAALVSRFALGECVLCVGYEHVVKSIRFTPGKIMYGLAFGTNPDGDVIEYPSENVYPLPPSPAGMN
jgi:hypothetical protein